MRHGLELRHGRVPVRSLSGFLLLSLFAFWVGQPDRLAGPTTSVIQGTVTDRQHLAIIGAEIKISGPILASEIKTASDANGSYRIPGLQPGTYSVQVAQPGFAVKRYDVCP